MGTNRQIAALVVDHDPQVRRMAVRLLKQQGMDPSEAADLAEAHDRVAATRYELVLAHLTLPDGTGTDLLADLVRQRPETATILISGSKADGVADDALAEGVDDYLPTPFSSEQLAVSVTRALRRSSERVSSGQRQHESGSIGEPAHSFLAEEVLDFLTRAGRFRDEETAEHVERVGRSCALIGGELGLSATECATLRAASAMHDIGKVGVPDTVLGKPGKLNAEERKLIERHADIGYRILCGSDDPVLDLAATIAWTHHERADGKGYPRGLAGGDIPLAGSITAVADVFDALTSDRVYRPALTVDEALELMWEGDGTQFNSEVLGAFQAVTPQIEAISQLYPDSTAPDAAPSGSEAADSPLRVLVVEDHAAVARGLTLLLLREGMEIAGTAGTLPEAERLIADRDVDVVVLDANLDGDNGLQLIPAAHGRGARVLLYTGGTSQQHGPAEEIPDGVASKAGGPTELLTAIRDVAGGGSPTDSRVRPPTVRAASLARARPLLTSREREITALLALGHSGEDIATQLFLSHHTVRTHIRNAMIKAGAKTRSHLVVLALAAGEIPAVGPPLPVAAL